MFNYFMQLPWKDFLYDVWVMVLLVIVICGLVLIVVVGRGLPSYLKTKDGKGVAYGFVLAPIVIFILGLVMFLAGFLVPRTASASTVPEAVYVPQATSYSISPKSDVAIALDNTRWRIPGRFLTRGYVFMGLDYTRKISPMCDAGFYNDRLTSNMGAGVVLWQVTPRVSLHMVYTHHSCALNPDARSYDALGLRLHFDVYNAY